MKNQTEQGEILELSVRVESEFENDMLDIVRAFYPYIKINPESDELYIKTLLNKNKAQIIINYPLNNNIHTKKLSSDTENSILLQETEEVLIKRKAKRFFKNNLYKFLSVLCGVSLPYGSITGVRPTGLFYQLEEEGFDAESRLINEFYVSSNKARLIAETVSNQKEHLQKRNTDDIDIYVNIPVCVSKCSYCSFPSSELKYVKNLMDSYTEKVKEDINISLKIIKDKGKKIKRIYFGGGTPTSLSANNLSVLLNCFENTDYDEFTVEAGRADTVDKEKLDIISKFATRISLNPQTFNEKTLKKIGRLTTVEQFMETYELAKKYSFYINMDLIAALPGERFEDFEYSLNKTIELKPENITIHTLSLKNGSDLKNNNYYDFESNEVKKSLNCSYSMLFNAGYFPYYMYRQKNCIAGQENTGYAKKFPCLYNIDMMEECSDILACGAGGISKRIFSGGRHERFPSLKGIKEYIERFDEIKNKKIDFFNL